MRDYEERQEHRKRELAEAAAALEARFHSGADRKWTPISGHKGHCCRINGRAYRLAKDADNKHLLHRIEHVGDLGAFIGLCGSRADASQALQALAYSGTDREFETAQATRVARAT